MSIKDGIKPLSDPNNRGFTCIEVGRDYGDWEVVLDVCLNMP
ncbi:hypothetical protein [Vulcanisaeta distributa]|uniref:Uncharacterized protein n=1 Tax=Vulcanisaeta distributa (strain DSM 14429 / JCM 11212 / NBRC 100878 / IC-017) TaxID=572478 RepID=E1QSQ0_VULDI|nr:hypothetical protein [Vulcanisaeta distributa]ADN49567.1 hypothetical protein Vdis_0154 [Vulcanisaeta distributa DSM 14429]